MLIDVGLLILAYFLGAIPTGLLIGKTRGINIREHGSKNIGATNVWRVLGWKFGLPCFLIDVAKGALAVVLAQRLGTGTIPELQIFAGLLVLLGNFFNVFLGFKGGKGVATSLGVFLALAFWPMVISFGLFLLALWITKYVSVGSLVATFTLPLLTLYWQGFSYVFWLMCIIAVNIIWRHRTNIQRLMNGTEAKFNAKKKSAAEPRE